MATYRSSKDLKGKVLKEDDIVYFNDLKYSVTFRFLNNLSSDSNSEIFDRLGIRKKEFCEHYYKYSDRGGVWPEYKDHDYKAITNVVMALFRILEDEPIPDKFKIESKDSDSKELDSKDPEHKKYEHQEFKFNSIKPKKVYF